MDDMVDKNILDIQEYNGAPTMSGNIDAITDTPDGAPARSFRTLLEELATIVRKTRVTRSAKTPSPAFPMVTSANATQQRALHLLQRISM